MQISRIKMFFQLYQKEMHELLPEIMVTVIAVVISGVLFYSAGEDGSRWLVTPFILVAGLAGLIPVISSFRLLSKEWSNNTVYLIMSLPVKGGMILGSKMLALVTQYIIGTATVIVTGILLAFSIISDFPEIMDYVQVHFGGIPWDLAIVSYVFTVVLLAYIVGLSFFSQIVGKLVTRYNGLVTVLTFIFTSWLINKFHFVLGQVVTIGENIDPNLFPTQVLAGGTVITLAEAVLLLLLAVIIYNRKIEL